MRQNALSFFSLSARRRVGTTFSAANVPSRKLTSCGLGKPLGRGEVCLILFRENARTTPKNSDKGFVLPNGLRPSRPTAKSWGEEPERGLPNCSPLRLKMSAQLHY